SPIWVFGHPGALNASNHGQFVGACTGGEAVELRQPRCLVRARFKLRLLVRWPFARKIKSVEVNSKVAEVETEETALQGKCCIAVSRQAHGLRSGVLRFRFGCGLSSSSRSPSVFSRWPWLHKMAPQQSAALSGTAGAREYPTLEQNCRPADLRRRYTTQKLMAKDSTAFRACLRAITR